MVSPSLYLFAREVANGGLVCAPDRIVLRALSEVMIAQSRSEQSIERAQRALAGALKALGDVDRPKASGE